MSTNFQGQRPNNQPQPQPPKPEEPRLFPVKLLRGYWPLDGRGKVAAGSTLSLPVEEARGLVEAEIAKRNDPIE